MISFLSPAAQNIISAPSLRALAWSPAPVRAAWAVRSVLATAIAVYMPPPGACCYAQCSSPASLEAALDDSNDRCSRSPSQDRRFPQIRMKKTEKHSPAPGILHRAITVARLRHKLCPAHGWLAAIKSAPHRITCPRRAPRRQRKFAKRVVGASVPVQAPEVTSSCSGGDWGGVAVSEHCLSTRLGGLGENLGNQHQPWWTSEAEVVGGMPTLSTLIGAHIPTIARLSSMCISAR